QVIRNATLQDRVVFLQWKIVGEDLVETDAAIAVHVAQRGEIRRPYERGLYVVVAGADCYRPLVRQVVSQLAECRELLFRANGVVHEGDTGRPRVGVEMGRL